MQRESIFAALWAQVSSAVQYTFQVKSRRWVHWNKSPVPALYQVDGITYDVTQLGEGAVYGASKYILTAQLWAYNNASPSQLPSNVPSQIANTMLDAIEFAVNPYLGERQTLGGLVENAFVEGKGYVDPGIAEDGKIILMVPIQMIVTGFSQPSQAAY